MKSNALINYQVHGWSKTAAEDSYKDGEIGLSSSSGSDDIFEANSIDELIPKLMEFVNVDERDNVLLNSCDDIGRIDIQKQENEDGETPTPKEIAEWKKGKKVLYNSTYTFNVERHIIDIVDLSGIEGYSIVNE